MDFKKSYLLFIPLFIFTSGCKTKEKSNTDNTYFIELVNFNHDSLKQNVSEKLFGKVSFYKKDKLEIVSTNYITEDFPRMHFYKNAAELTNEIKPETKKIRIEFGGKFTIDSISYSLQKFIYRDKQWIKTSDMGFLKGTTTYYRARLDAVNEFGKQILYSTVTYTYN